MTRSLTIAVASSRNSKKWKNKTVDWSDLLDQLSESTETRETIAEYNRKAKAERDNIKDIGGFTGGGLKGPQRINENFAFKDLLTLDLDSARQDFWDDLTMFQDFACCVYSTHSSTPETPHLRLVAPLSRRCDADEYAALARKIAEDIGIDQVDPASFRTVQMMYWPSHPTDVTPVFEHQDGEWIDVDEVLSRYVDWHDVSNWPLTPNEKQAFSNVRIKAADPLQKEGLIGAFCRTYSVPEAIDKFIPEIYSRGSSEDRYTYTAGSSANGLVIYQDGVLAYSNHATDPAAGHALNAWDIVRIHLFGSEDQNADQDTPVNKLPSYKSMSDMVRNDPDTSATLNLEQVKAAQEAFADINVNVDDESYDWVKQLERDQNGKRIAPTINNYYMILSNDPQLKDCCGRFNEFTDLPEHTGDPAPWNSHIRPGVNWQDTDDSGLRMYIERVYKINNRNNLDDALANYQNSRAFHPVRDYLDGLEWDGTERLDTLLIDYLGADDTPLIRAVTRKTVCGAVDRAYHPGCEFQQMLILTGDQGCGKSTLAKKLGRKWFSDTIDTAGDTRGTDRFDQLQGVWIGEDSELSRWSKQDVAASKKFVSASTDTYRKKFNKRAAAYPRQCIFIGTTNNPRPLHDNSGNRRYWVVEVHARTPGEKNVWNDLTDDVIDQIYAEAKYRLKHGEKTYLDSKALVDALNDQQEEFLDEDPWEAKIREYLDTPITEDWYDRSVNFRADYCRDYYSADGITETGHTKRQYVCVAEIIAECLKPAQEYVTRSDSRRITEIMDHRIEGWERGSVKGGKRFNGYGKQKYFQRVSANKSQEDDVV